MKGNDTNAVAKSIKSRNGDGVVYENTRKQWYSHFRKKCHNVKEKLSQLNLAHLKQILVLTHQLQLGNPTAASALAIDCPSENERAWESVKYSP